MTTDDIAYFEGLNGGPLSQEDRRFLMEHGQLPSNEQPLPPDMNGHERRGNSRQQIGTALERQPGDESEFDGPEPELVRLDTVKPKPIDWLWQDRFAIGKYSEIVGDPGLSKSFLTLDFAARVSNGTPWPDGSPNEAGGVVLLSAEDDTEDTVVPRLLAAGADLSHIAALQAVENTDPETGKKYSRSVRLDTDLDAIEKALQRTWNCRFVVIDPVTAYMGKADSHKDADVRGTLAPLCRLAAQYKVAVIGVKHLNKASGANALYRATGSLAFVAAARAVWLVCIDPDDVTARRRLLLPLKNNLAANRPGLAYVLRPNDFGGGQPVICWDDTPVTTTAADVLEQQKPARKSKTEVAEAWLEERLAGGPVLSDELEKDAKAAGITGGTYRRARVSLSVEAVKDGDKWLTKLPA